MATWFDKEHPQKVTLKTTTVLVGKAPTKAKRIRMNFTMDLTDGAIRGMPEWLLDAREFVMKTGQTASDKLTVKGVNIVMGDPNLFKKKPVESPRSDLRKFEVYQAGTADEPETFLSYIVYAPFSTDLWRWCGQMAGEAFTSTFEGIATASDDQNLSLSPEDEDDDEEEDDLIDDEDEEDEEEAEATAMPESQSARASRIRREAMANAAAAPPQARGPVNQLSR